MYHLPSPLLPHIFLPYLLPHIYRRAEKSRPELIRGSPISPSDYLSNIRIVLDPFELFLYTHQKSGVGITAFYKGE